MRKAVTLLGATPAGLWSPLIGRKPAIWSPLGASRPGRASSLSGACLPDMPGGPLAKMKGTESRWGAVSASILFFLLYCWGKQLQRGFKAYSRPRIWSVKDIWGLHWMFSVWESTSQFRAIRLDPWSGNRSHKPAMQPEKKKSQTLPPEPSSMLGMCAVMPWGGTQKTLFDIPPPPWCRHSTITHGRNGWSVCLFIYLFLCDCGVCLYVWVHSWVISFVYLPVMWI